MTEELKEFENDSPSAKAEGDIPDMVRAVCAKRRAEPVVVMTRQLVEELKDIQEKLKGESRKNYPDPNRITVPVSTNATITYVSRHKAVPIPNYVMFPRPALVRGKPIKVGQVKGPDGYGQLPIYVAADCDGSPMKDSKGTGW